MYVKDDRNFVTFLILNFITCGIYGIYFWYLYVEDINTVFYGDGEDSPNYILVLVLSLITCGIMLTHMAIVPIPPSISGELIILTAGVPWIMT